MAFTASATSCVPHSAGGHPPSLPAHCKTPKLQLSPPQGGPVIPCSLNDAPGAAGAAPTPKPRAQQGLSSCRQSWGQDWDGKIPFTDMGHPQSHTPGWGVPGIPRSFPSPPLGPVPPLDDNGHRSLPRAPGGAGRTLPQPRPGGRHLPTPLPAPLCHSQELWCSGKVVPAPEDTAPTPLGVPAAVPAPFPAPL